MREMLRFASQNVPRKMDGKGLPRDGFETVAGVVRIGCAL